MMKTGTAFRFPRKMQLIGVCSCIMRVFIFSVQGKLRQFVLDLHSGKLHREFHHGPDPTVAPSTDTVMLFCAFIVIVRQHVFPYIC